MMNRIKNMKLDYNTMKVRCLADIKAFKALGNVEQTQSGMYIYSDRKSDILAVCHLDTVLSLKHFYINHIGDDDIIFNAQLDDRLGAYVILDLLPKLGLNYDILLTEGEESGQSTAQYFDTIKAYKWAFSFERHGEDAVLYQYHGKDWENALKASGFKIGVGSFYDIAFLEHLGVKCVNIGTGY